MKKSEEIRVREAVDRRLSSLESSSMRRERIRQRIMEEEEPILRRKMTVGMAFVLAAALALSGIAVAAGVNLFELFGQRDGRLQHLSKQAELRTYSPQMIESDGLGQTTAAIVQAYYDGETLLAAYTIENARRVERYMPTAEQMEGAVRREKGDSPGIWLWHKNEEEQEILAEFKQAMEQGRPYGAAVHMVDVGFGGTTEDGVFLPGNTIWGEQSDADTIRAIYEFEYPLPEAARGRDRMTFSMELEGRTTYLFFDGSDLYVNTHSWEGEGEMRAEAECAKAARRFYAGEGVCGNIPVVVTAEMTPASGKLTIRAADESKAQYYGKWLYRQTIAVVTEQSERMDWHSGRLIEETGEVVWYLYGAGRTELSEQLELYTAYGNGFATGWGIVEQGEKIILNAVE